MSLVMSTMLDFFTGKDAKVPTVWQIEPLTVSVTVLEVTEEGSAAVALRWDHPWPAVHKGGMGLVASITFSELLGAWKDARQGEKTDAWNMLLSQKIDGYAHNFLGILCGYNPPMVCDTQIHEVLAEDEFEDVRESITAEDVRVSLASFLESMGDEHPVGEAVAEQGWDAADSQSRKMAEQIAEKVRARDVAV